MTIKHAVKPGGAGSTRTDEESGLAALLKVCESNYSAAPFLNNWFYIKSTFRGGITRPLTRMMTLTVPPKTIFHQLLEQAS